MRRSLLVLLLTITALGVGAQDKKSSSKKKSTNKKVTGHWTKGGMATLALAQAGSRNWAAGGDRFTLSANAFLTLYANETKGKCHWDNLVDASYGLQNSRAYGLIKNDDKLELTSRWSHDLGRKDVRRFRLGFILNFRTQFEDGYDYDGAEKRRISAFLAPGIFTASPGIEFYTKRGDFNAHLGFASRSVLVANRPYELAANYNVKPNREVKIEAGLHAVLNYNKDICKNVHLRSSMDLFSDFVAHDPANVDVYFTNMFNLRINNWLSAVYSFDLKYDDDTRIFGYTKTRPDTQLKSIFGIGASVKF